MIYNFSIHKYGTETYRCQIEGDNYEDCRTAVEKYYNNKDDTYYDAYPMSIQTITSEMVDKMEQLNAEKKKLMENVWPIVRQMETVDRGYDIYANQPLQETESKTTTP